MRNLVEFIFNSGDIDNRTGTSAADVKRMQEGARIHRAIQKQAGAGYAAEVALKLDYAVSHKNSYVIALEGRADGVLTEDNENTADAVQVITIDEIKTVTGDVHKIQEPIYVHQAQVMCYAYIYAVQNGLSQIRVRMTYYSIDTEEIKYFSFSYVLEELEKWFTDLMERFAKWTDFVLEERDNRNASIKGLPFPYPYRKGQKNLAASVYRSCEQHKNLYIQAPTGTGKTLSTIYPSVMAVGEGHAEKIFYLTAKTITRTVAQDTYALLRERGLHFRSVTLTARDKICILDERNCNPESCPMAKGHYDRVNDAVYDVITHEMAIDRGVVEQYAAKHNVCPFEMALDISVWCDGIICDYNYVFDPNVRLKRFFADGDKGSYIFLVDESHNLVDRARAMYSAQLVKEDFLAVKKLVKGMDNKLYAALERCNKELLAYKRECEEYMVYTDISAFIVQLERMFSLLMKFLDSNRRFQHMDALTEFFLNVRHFLNMYDLRSDKYIIYTEHNSSGDFVLRLYCVDPSDNIVSCVEQGLMAVFFSATLLPIRYFKEMLTGDDSENAVYAHSCFDPDRRKILVGNAVSSRYTRRNEAEYGRIVRYISNIVHAREGNYLVFFPSYRYMENVFCRLKEMDGEMGGLSSRVLCQEAAMTEQDREEYLQHFMNSKAGVVGFCVMGGIFSEGIDLRKEQLIGAIIVGTGLPMVCTEQTILKEYFDAAGKNGFDYAYIYPGMNKVLQAAGRVIRTEEDRGIIALLDERFLRPEYQEIFPREWAEYSVVSIDKAGELAKEFWDEGII